VGADIFFGSSVAEDAFALPRRLRDQKKSKKIVDPGSFL
jgi:hypothetical protein